MAVLSELIRHLSVAPEVVVEAVDLVVAVEVEGKCPVATSFMKKY